MESWPTIPSEGREAGKRGGRAAARYLVKFFKPLQPAGTNRQYNQPFGAGYQNLIGILPGHDPELKNELIVVGAHYDHVGYGNRSNSNGPFGYIHNGADDNASGTSAVLELIEAFSQMHAPRRTIVFALWDGEEKGLLGSEHWCANPTLPFSNIKFMINLDMIGRLTENKVDVIGSRSAMGLRQLTARANRDALLYLNFTWKLDDNSDHHPFYKRGVPVLMLHTGLHDDYHTPRDDAHLIDHEGIQRITKLVFNTSYELANTEDVPRHRESAKYENEFRRKQFEATLAQPARRFGFSWQETDAAKGRMLRVSAITVGGPANRAGIQINDELVALNGSTIQDSDELVTRILSSTSPAKLSIRRNSQEFDIDVPLSGEPTRLGISWRENDAEPQAVTLVRVVDGSLADRAGLRLKDRIWSVNGNRFKNSEEFLKQVNSQDFPIRFGIERQGIVTELKLDSLERLQADTST